MTAKFSLGRVVITPGAKEALETAGQSADYFLSLHASGSWGDLDTGDRRLNDEAIAHEGDLDKQSRVFSSYRTHDNEKVWVITEWDRSVTTILLPNEY
jgi:hypothetical protein